MEVTDALSFEDDVRRQLYEYVEREGTVRADDARRALGLDPGAFGTHVTLLVRQGYLRRTNDHLEVAYDEPVVTEHEGDGVEYLVRRAVQDDWDGLVSVMRSVASEGEYFAAETVADRIEHDEVVLRHTETETRVFFVACVDDDVVGWVHLDLKMAEKLSHTARLTVGLLPDYRGQGIGSTLLDRGVSWAAEHGLEKLYNGVPATNERAVAFLDAHGWETEAVRTDHYRIEGDHVDEVLLAKRL